MDNKTPKKRAAISYENMSQELLDAFKEKYPHGYADYLSDIIKVDKPDGSCFYAVSLEVPDAIYLVKIKVKVDDREDIENGLFKDETGLSVIDYINRHRISQAESMLSDQSLAIKDVAYSVGFSDQMYFSKVFKKHTGKTPTEYKRLIVEKGSHDRFGE